MDNVVDDNGNDNYIVVAEEPPRKPGKFTKGDPRINRKGRPKVFDELRALALLIAHEKHGNTTTIEALMRKWATGRNPKLQQAFVEIAFGKVPQSHIISGTDGEAASFSLLVNAALSVVYGKRDEQKSDDNNNNDNDNSNG